MQEYLLRKPEIEKVVGPVGIFLFPDRPSGDLDRVGSVVFQVGSKHTFRVVELAVTYAEADLKPALHDDGRPCTGHRAGPCVVSITHTGHLGDPTRGKPAWVYHDKPMVVVNGPIYLDRIEHVRTYDIRDMLA